MKLLSWNVRGCNALDKLCLIKRVLDQAKVDVVFLQETKLSGNNKFFLSNKLVAWKGLMVDVEGASGGLGICWKEYS